VVKQQVCSWGLMLIICLNQNMYSAELKKSLTMLKTRLNTLGGKLEAESGFKPPKPPSRPAGPGPVRLVKSAFLAYGRSVKKEPEQLKIGINSDGALVVYGPKLTDAKSEDFIVDGKVTFPLAKAKGIKWSSIGEIIDPGPKGVFVLAPVIHQAAQPFVKVYQALARPGTNVKQWLREPNEVLARLEKKLEDYYNEYYQEYIRDSEKFFEKSVARTIEDNLKNYRKEEGKNEKFLKWLKRWEDSKEELLKNELEEKLENLYKEYKKTDVKDREKFVREKELLKTLDLYVEQGDVDITLRRWHVQLKQGNYDYPTLAQ